MNGGRRVTPKEWQEKHPDQARLIKLLIEDHAKALKELEDA